MVELATRRWATHLTRQESCDAVSARWATVADRCRREWWWCAIAGASAAGLLVTARWGSDQGLIKEKEAVRVRVRMRKVCEGFRLVFLLFRLCEGDGRRGQNNGKVQVGCERERAGVRERERERAQRDDVPLVRDTCACALCLQAASCRWLVGP